MSGLPLLKLDDREKIISVAEVKELIEEEQDVSKKDATILSMFFLEADCRNLLDIIKGREGATMLPGKYSREELEEMIEDARETSFEDDPRFPSFLAEFVREYDERKDDANYFADDALLSRYWTYVKGAKNSVVAQWAELNLNISNILTAFIARQQGWDVSKFIVGDGDVHETLLVSKAKDFDLSREYDYVAALMKIVECDNPVEKERQIDALRWMWLDDMTFFDGFAVETLYAYLCKAQMLERWRLLDPVFGRERFEEIIENLRSEARVPEEFKR